MHIGVIKMSLPNPDKIQAFETPEALNAWLQKNHKSEDELFVKIYKKASKVPSVTWNDVVLETLCYGWIDGVKKSLDDKAYLQRITPRKARSGWSKRNTEHVAKLISQGKMQPAGLAEVNAAKADGRWENAYAPASEMKIPDDFLNAVQQNPKVSGFYNTLNKTNLYAIAYGLRTAKKAETRERRFKKFFEMLEREEKPGFGFKQK
jgi:uncharacterized protein YdeI (YjbR/CyaY-like superfamily)